MLQEYALEPSLLSRWSDFRFFVGHFGFDRGRLIARYPKRWKRLVYESLTNCGEIERAKIEEALRRIDDRLVPRRSDTWNGNLDWLTNAEEEHRSRPFWAIIAQSNPRTHSEVIVGDDVHDILDWDVLPLNDARRLWRAHHSRIIKRTAKEMADAIDAFMRQADEILFVDKHFGPENPRHRIPFQEFMLRLDNRPSDKMPSRMEVHCAKKSEAGFFAAECQSKLAGMIPITVKMRFIRWGLDDLHNRFVLTELGGMAFLEGLDQFMGNGREDDVVVLLDKDVARQLMQEFTAGTSRFSLQDQLEINGTRSKP